MLIVSEVQSRYEVTSIIIPTIPPTQGPEKKRVICMTSKMEQFQFLDLVHSQTALKMSWFITISKSKDFVLGKVFTKWINWGMNKTLDVCGH